MSLAARISWSVFCRVLLLVTALSCLVPSAPVVASGGIDPADPMVRVTSPPTDIDVDATLIKVGQEVSAATGIDEKFITYFWQTFDNIIYDGAPTSAPLFVDLYVPGFFSDDQVEGMITAVADALVTHTGIERKWLFIHTHYPLQGQVYIGGELQHWDNYRGRSDSMPRDPEQRSMKGFLFNDGAFVFQSLWRFGTIASGAADLGELLTATSRIKDFDKESWYDSWNAMARQLRATAREFEAAGHKRSAMQAYFRATTYFRAASIYLYGNDPRGFQAWQDGRDTFLKAASLSEGRIAPVRIPYEDTTLPGYYVTVDGSGKKRPLLLIQTGLDGTAEDLYFIMAAQAVKRGYNCLVYEGPGQGEMISQQQRPFRYDWEKVVTPVVDYAMELPETDAERLAILGYSMGGYLVPRALAFEKRIRWGIVDGGVYSVFDGTMTKFPDNVRQTVAAGNCDAAVDKLVTQEMATNPKISQFINQMFWTFQAKSPCALFEKLQRFSVADSIGDIETEMLVVNSSEDQVAGSEEQARLFYNELQTQKTYLEFDAAQGTQFHCQLGAPLASSERILNWLDERAQPQVPPTL